MNGSKAHNPLSLVPLVPNPISRYRVERFHPDDWNLHVSPGNQHLLRIVEAGILCITHGRMGPELTRTGIVPTAHYSRRVTSPFKGLFEELKNKMLPSSKFSRRIGKYTELLKRKPL